VRDPACARSGAFRPPGAREQPLRGKGKACELKDQGGPATWAGTEQTPLLAPSLQIIAVFYPLSGEMFPAAL